MATGGYKCVSFSWQGGRTDSKVDRVKFILNGIAQAIVDADVGWQLDTLTSTTNDFIVIPSSSNSNYPILVKVLQLSYDDHTYKLGLGYVYSGSSTGGQYKINPDDCCNTRQQDSYTSSQNGYFNAGMFIGMVKDGAFIQDNTYGLVWDGNGIFTKWSPFSSIFGELNSSFAGDNVGDVMYTYFMLLKNAQVILLERKSSWTIGARLKGFIIGEIFKGTGHVSDEITMGTVCLHGPMQDEVGDPSPVYINSNLGVIQFPTFINNYQVSSIIDPEGKAYAGDKCSSIHNTEYQPYMAFDSSVIDDLISSPTTSPGGRWTPCYMALRAVNHNLYNVVPGDGFKGYLDTDLIRGTSPNYTYGQLVNGKTFVYIGGGFVIGWDPSNTEALF